MSLEQLVRPFVAPRSLVSRRIIPSKAELTVETAGRTWGAAGLLPSPRETEEPGPAPQISINVKIKPEKNKTRALETEQVRIEQPDNPDNYVILERIKKITYGQDAPPTLVEKSPLRAIQGGGSAVFSKPSGWQPGDPEEQFHSWVYDTPVIIDPKTLEITWPPA